LTSAISGLLNELKIGNGDTGYIIQEFKLPRYENSFMPNHSAIACDRRFYGRFMVFWLCELDCHVTSIAKISGERGKSKQKVFEKVL
jgi:hypothetical protein